MNPPRPLSREEDAFWTVALDNGDDSFPKERKYDRFSARTCVYELALPEPYGTLRCPLAHLPLPFGTERSTGAQAWYGSALLSALFLQTSDDEIVRIQRHICAHTDRSGTSDLSILELGSGAVGLSGIVAGFAMLAHLRTASARAEEAISCRVFLTDRDAPVTAVGTEPAVQRSAMDEAISQVATTGICRSESALGGWLEGKRAPARDWLGTGVQYRNRHRLCPHGTTIARPLPRRVGDIGASRASRRVERCLFADRASGRGRCDTRTRPRAGAPGYRGLAGRARRDPRSADRFHPLSHLQSSG
jgi:Lysine methyltransferase